MRVAIAATVMVVVLLSIILMGLILWAGAVRADPPGPPGTWQETVHSAWFARQHNIIRQSCRSNADDHLVDDADWRSNNGSYEVRVAGVWYKMPPQIMRDSNWGGPNEMGKAIVWYTYDSTQLGYLRFWCFAPGSQF